MQPVIQATQYYYAFEKPELMIDHPKLFWFSVGRQAKFGVYLTDSGKWEKSGEESHATTNKCVLMSFHSIQKFFADLNNFKRHERMFSAKNLRTFFTEFQDNFLHNPPWIEDMDSFLSYEELILRSSSIEIYRKILKDVESNHLDLKYLPSSIDFHPKEFSAYFSSIRIFIENLPDLIKLIELNATQTSLCQDFTYDWKTSDSADIPPEYVGGRYKWVSSKKPLGESLISESLQTLRQYVFFGNLTFLQMIVLDITEAEIAMMLILLRAVHTKYKLLSEFEKDAGHLNYLLTVQKPLLKATLFKDIAVAEAPKAKALIIEDVD